MILSRRSLVRVALVAVASSSAASAQSRDSVIPGPWVFSSAFGVGTASGEYGSFLTTPLTFDYMLGYDKGPWRFGVGIAFGSMDMKSPYEDQKEWAHHDVFVFAGRRFRTNTRVRPYVMGRLAIARIDPRSELFETIPFDSAAPEANRVQTVNGIGFTLQPGVEIDLNSELAIDAGATINIYKTADYDLTPINRAPVNTGEEYEFRLGLNWRPVKSTRLQQLTIPTRDSTGKIVPLPPESSEYDAWGVTRSWGWAIGEMLAVNTVATAANEYFRGVFFSQVSPRSFWYNITHSSTYDDNEFKNNQFNHPFNGSTYFNSARANGLSFWHSYIVGFTGAYLWECCGETHPISYNDLIATGLGGMAFGEAVYRLSSLVLDNNSTGTGRALREVGAFVIDPIRGFNRLVSGDAFTTEGNPSNPYDKRAPWMGMQLLAGVRGLGQGSSFTDNLHYYGFGELNLAFGSTNTNTRHHPFDHFDVSLQANFGEEQTLGHFIIRGDLLSKTFGDGPEPKHAIALVQDFDYVENSAYLWGGTMFGGAFTSRFHPGTTTTLQTRAEISALVLGGVNSEYAKYANVPTASRLREYDYGPGAGLTLEAQLYKKKRPLLYGYYRFIYMNVSNGSLVNGGDTGGSSAHHYLQAGTLRLTIPLGQTIGVGTDFSIYLRNSEFSAPEFTDISQRNPQFRLFASWDLADGL